MFTKQSLIIGTLYSFVLLGTFFADTFLFSVMHNSLLQITLSLFIVSALRYAPSVILLGQMIALCLLSLLFFGSIETYLFLTILIIAFVRMFNIILHQRFMIILATVASTFVAQHVLLSCTYYQPSVLYTVQQFCANLVVVLVLFIIFEKVRHTR